MCEISEIHFITIDSHNLMHPRIQVECCHNYGQQPTPLPSHFLHRSREKRQGLITSLPQKNPAPFPNSYYTTELHAASSKSSIDFLE